METIYNPLPELKSLTECLDKKVKEGYTYNFKATEKGLVCNETEDIFKPEQVKIKDFYRFEGMSDPEDNSILYAIETVTGLKGTLVDAYGAYGDAEVDKFIKSVENITKKNATS